MEKHKLYGLWHKYRTISLLIIISGLIIFGLLSIFALRQNNIRMLQLKETVIKIDESGGDVEKALTDLRTHVFSHMNTNMRTGDSSELPIQLASRYNKYITEQQARLTASGQPDIYTKAQANSFSLYSSSVSKYIVKKLSFYPILEFFHSHNKEFRYWLLFRN